MKVPIKIDWLSENKLLEKALGLVDPDLDVVRLTSDGAIVHDTSKVDHSNPAECSAWYDWCHCNEILMEWDKTSLQFSVAELQELGFE